MIGVQDLRKGTIFIDEDQSIYKVIDYQHVKLGRGNAVVKVKVRNLRTKATLEKTFLTGGRVQDIRLDSHTIQYLYSDVDFCYFMDTTTFDQPTVSKGVLGEATKYLKEGVIIEMLSYNGESIDINLPTTVNLKVIETAPGFKGDTASGGGKPAVLETGLVVQVPFFISVGNIVQIDTRNGTYLIRV